MNLPFLPAFSHGGRFARGWPRLIVIHSTEGPMSRGNARALAGPAWFGGPKAGTSAHTIFDPTEGVEMVKPDTVAWHVGPGGNTISVGAEHCGRVSLSREQWLSEDAKSMLRLSAQWNAQLAHLLNIPPRWLTLTQLAGGAAGFCTHNDIRLALGGTTHSDPGPNFPYAWYMSQVQGFHAGSPVEEDDMPLTDADVAKVATAVWAKVAAGLSDPTHQYLQDELAPLKSGLQQVKDAQTQLAEVVSHMQTGVPSGEVVVSGTLHLGGMT